MAFLGDNKNHTNTNDYKKRREAELSSSGNDHQVQRRQTKNLNKKL